MGVFASATTEGPITHPSEGEAKKTPNATVKRPNMVIAPAEMTSFVTVKGPKEKLTEVSKVKPIRGTKNGKVSREPSSGPDPTEDWSPMEGTGKPTFAHKPSGKTFVACSTLNKTMAPKWNRQKAPSVKVPYDKHPSAW